MVITKADWYNLENQAEVGTIMKIYFDFFFEYIPLGII